MELASLKVPILPGFIVDADVAADLEDVSLIPYLKKAFAKIEPATGKVYGDPDNPMLVKIVISPAIVITTYPGLLHNYGLAAGALNEAIGLVHDNRLTRQQHIMFALADMMTHVEVGASLARKAVNLSDAGAPEAEKFRAMSRVFACEVAQLVAQNVVKILMGPGVFDRDTVQAFMAKIEYDQLVSSYWNVIQDMDTVADFLFKRK